MIKISLITIGMGIFIFIICIIIGILFEKIWDECEKYYNDDKNKQLKEYQQLEEQGRLLKLPCKTGDTVYEVNPLTSKITERKIMGMQIFNAPELTVMYISEHDYAILGDEFDKTVFLTRNEAESKLAELRGGSNDSVE